MERNTDDKQSFVNSYCVFIFKDKESNIRSIDKLTKHLAISRRTRYSLFERCVSLRDNFLYAKENVK